MKAVFRVANRSIWEPLLQTMQPMITIFLQGNDHDDNDDDNYEEEDGDSNKNEYGRRRRGRRRRRTTTTRTTIFALAVISVTAIIIR